MLSAYVLTSELAGLLTHPEPIANFTQSDFVSHSSRSSAPGIVRLPFITCVRPTHLNRVLRTLTSSPEAVQASAR